MNQSDVLLQLFLESLVTGYEPPEDVRERLLSNAVEVNKPEQRAVPFYIKMAEDLALSHGSLLWDRVYPMAWWGVVR